MDNISGPIILLSLAVVGSIIFALTRKNKTNSEEQITKAPQIKLKQHKDKPNDQAQKTEQVDQQGKQKKKKPKKKKAAKQVSEQPKNVKTQKQIEEIYAQIYYGSINLKSQQNSIHGPTCIAFKNSKILVGTTKNELILYDLKKWKKQDPKSLQKYFVSLDNNTPTAVCFGGKNYYAALNFDKTIVCYEFIGENGVYFKQYKKFFRNILKSDASAMFVPEDQKYIITAGSGADTNLNVFSQKGEKLHSFDTYQIEHYNIQFSLKTIMVRGWTSEIKLFEIQNDKNGNFVKFKKNPPLAIPDQPLCASIDNFCMHSLSISKQFKISLWDLHPKNPSKMEMRIAEPYQIDLDEIQTCLVHTLKDQNQRFKTITIFSDANKIVVCDREFKVHKIISGVQCKSLEIIGSMKNVVLMTQTKQGKLIVWNLTKIVQGFEQYSL